MFVSDTEVTSVSMSRSLDDPVERENGLEIESLNDNKGMNNTPLSNFTKPGIVGLMVSFTDAWVPVSESLA
jgi:hypothetical protein